MKVNIGKQGWQKRDVIESLLEELKENNKTVGDIKYIIYNGRIKYWVTWKEFISPKIKIKSYDTLDWIIVGDNWWIDRQYEGQDEDTATWNFRTKPEKPELKQGEIYKKILVELEKELETIKEMGRSYTAGDVLQEIKFLKKKYLSIKGVNNMGCFEVCYKCPKCGKVDSMEVQSWYQHDPMRCPECDTVMEEVSRGDDPDDYQN